MGTLADLITNTKVAMASRIGAVLTLRKYGTAETSNEIETASFGAQGKGLAVEIADGATVPLPSNAATQTTLAAVLAKLSADPATQTTLAAILALTAGARATTAPNLTDATKTLLSLARDGSLRVNADIYDHLHQTQLVVSTAAQQVAFTRQAPTYPFDGLWVQTDDVVVFGQPRGRPLLVPAFTAGNWTTAGTDWSLTGGKAVHAASGAGTDELVVASMGSPLVVGKTYLMYLDVTVRGGTSVTGYVGTAAGTAITATGTYVQCLVCTGSSTCKLVATDNCDCDVNAMIIVPRTPRLMAKAYQPFALSEIFGVANGATMTTLLAAATCEVHGLYRRVPGVADIG